MQYQYGCKGKKKKWGEQTIWLVFVISYGRIYSYLNDFTKPFSVRRRSVICI